MAIGRDSWVAQAAVPPILAAETMGMVLLMTSWFGGTAIGTGMLDLEVGPLAGAVTRYAVQATHVITDNGAMDLPLIFAAGYFSTPTRQACLLLQSLLNLCWWCWR